MRKDEDKCAFSSKSLRNIGEANGFANPTEK